MNQQRSIMIVDDNPDNLKLLGMALELAHYAVRPALSGELALRALSAYTPDLILLDINMPEMDGFEVCKRIWDDETTRDIPIIFISALDDIQSKLKAFQVGGVDYITKPFQFEEVLARVNTQLELSYTRRELSAANEQLRTMMDQLVQSEKLKSLGSLAAGIAHELNTPIGNALLTASTIHTISRDYMSTKDADKSSFDMNEMMETCNECAQLTWRNLERASKLITSFKKIAVDQTSERRCSIALRDCVNDVIAMMKYSHKHAHCIIDNTIAADLLIDTYPGRLEQILDNLITNSIVHGFNENQPGTIRIAAEIMSSGRLQIQVSDDGVGIPAEYLTRVFDPFFTTRLGQGGSGLGLHIVYTLVNNVLGGSINVTSQVGEGAKFSIILPLIDPVSDSRHRTETH